MPNSLLGPLDRGSGMKRIALNDWLTLNISSEKEDAVIGFQQTHTEHRSITSQRGMNDPQFM